MKATITLLCIVLVFSKLTYADIIPENCHYVNKCVVITNLADFPSVAVIGAIDESNNRYSARLIKDNECMNKGYKMNHFKVFAMSVEHFAEIDLESVNAWNDPLMLPANAEIEPEGYYVDDTNPLCSTKCYYQIIGFNESNMILHLYQEVKGYNNGLADSVKTYEYEGDTTEISKSLILGILPNNADSKFYIYPNPAGKDLNFSINGNSKSLVTIELYSINGDLVKSVNFELAEKQSKLSISTVDIPKGVYLVKATQDGISFSQKVIIP